MIEVKMNLFKMYSNYLVNYNSINLIEKECI